MRAHLRLVFLAVLGFSFLVSLSYVNRCRDTDVASIVDDDNDDDAETLRRRRRDCRRDAASSALLACPNSSSSTTTCVCDATALERIDVDVNDGEALVSARKEGSEVFVPFNFVRKYFDIYGKFADDGETRFLWSHSYSKIFRPTTPYTFDGPFMSFDNYKVEARDRVKCVSAIEGVPISTQWGPQGYFYPIQIAQFGLSHYSKELKKRQSRKEADADDDDDDDDADDDDGEDAGKNQKGFSWLKKKKDSSDRKRTEVIEDAEDRGHLAKWALPRDEAKATRILDAELETNVFHFQTDAPFAATIEALANHEESGVAVAFSPAHAKKLTLLTDLHFSRNASSISASLTIKGRGTFYVHFVGGCAIPLTLTPDSRHFLYGLGDRSNRRWIRVTRDLVVDLQKGLLLSKKHRKWATKLPRVTLEKIVLHGEGYLDNLTLAVEAHLPHFFAAANFFVRHQDETTGGWSIGVTRRLAGGLLTIPPGWLSAMGQGQAMSILARAFHLTRDDLYLRAALKATKPFTSRSGQGGGGGGVVAYLFDKFPWYEEYPTTPSLFVLNGFMYSLIGLYDLSRVAPKEESGAPPLAEELFRAGMDSLFRILPMFDTGSGSLYDLRHLHLPGVAPNLARWDYHSTHVNQLLLLSTIVEDEKKKQFLTATIERWIGYMKGKRAPHN